MQRLVLLSLLTLSAAGVLTALEASPEKEYLTDKEIAKIQDAQEIDERVKIYMEAAALRLKTAEDRLAGKEIPEGDPLEFFTTEDMLDGYYRILRSVMFNLDDVFQKPGPRWERLGKALKTLKGATSSADKELKILKKMAEEKQKEELWNLVNQAIDITHGAYEGAEYGLSKQPGTPTTDRKGR